MSSFSGNPSQRGSSSFANYQFDFGIGSARSSAASRPLKDQNPTPATATSAAPSWGPQPPAQPSWAHQPGSRSGGLATPPPSMVGDIFGKSWTAAAPPPSSSSSRLGVPNPNPNLFGDLLGSALNQSKSSSNAPLKSAPPATASAKSSFSMGGLSDSLPKTAAAPAPMRPAGTTQIGSQMGGRQPMRSMPSVSMNSKKDPFGSLADFGSKPAAKPSMGSANQSSNDYSFGAFQNAKNQTFPSPQPPPPPQQQSQSKSGGDSFEMLFSSPASSVPPPVVTNGRAFSEMNDWDLGSEFGGADGGGTTTELEGLPPPPAGVTALAAKTKGIDNHKQGQYADAIKWLGWAVVLLEKAANNVEIIEVLSCRASCYKEVGEYKKAVADCSKVLEQDGTNVPVLLQRALLYESTEKYKLGAEDLRMVLKIDPGNRLARSTIHRLNKLAD